MDSWRVLVGEICLARTRASDVPAVFAGLQRLAPSPAALIAHPDPVASLRALGLAARAEILVEVARTLATRFAGSVPDSEPELRSIPGVGDYVAQAGLCFGFGRRAVLLDATTARVVRRFFGRGDRRRWQIRLDLYQLAGSAGPDASFNHALLDHGALVCRAGRPCCHACPVLERCVARGGGAEGPQLTLPTGAFVDAG
jgi:A/G-specific adenine glycosylase